jgi:hypothetical protein
MTYNADLNDPQSLVPKPRYWPNGISDEDKIEIISILAQISQLQTQQLHQSNSSQSHQDIGHQSQRDIPSSSQSDGKVSEEVEALLRSPTMIGENDDETALEEQQLNLESVGLLSAAPVEEHTRPEDISSTTGDDDPRPRSSLLSEERHQAMSIWSWDNLPGSESLEMYCVRWETDLLLQLGLDISVS